LKTDFPRLKMEYSEELKGLAIIFVIFGHLCGMKFFDIDNANPIAATGVAIFLFLSGFGLMKSYMKKGIDSNFLYRRVKKVIIPYWIVTIIWIFVDEVFGGIRYNFKNIAMSLVGFKSPIDSTMWFISYILMFYVCFFVCFKLKKSNSLKLFLLVIVSASISMLIYKINLGDISTEYYIHYLPFPIGCFIALHSNKLAKYFTQRKLLITLSLLCLICSILYVHYIPNVMININLYVLTDIVSMIFFILLTLILSYFNIKLNLLIRIGGLSFYIYLFEGVFLKKYAILNFNNKILSLICYLIAIITLSLILDKITKMIFRKKSIATQ